MTKLCYLDQNKWIEIAQATFHEDLHERYEALMSAIGNAVADGGLIFPLTSTNIYETNKVNDPHRRQKLAYIQSLYSRGFVIRDRIFLKRREIERVLNDILGRQHSHDEPRWFLSTFATDAFPRVAEFEHPEVNFPLIFKLAKQNPPGFMYELLIMRDGEEWRRTGINNWTASSREFILGLERDRDRQKNEKTSMRRRIYKIRQVIGEIDSIIEIAKALGFDWSAVGDIGKKNLDKILNECSIYYCERELVLAREVQESPITENDIRDIGTYSIAVPFCDIVVGEKNFINICRQTQLHKKYNTKLSTDIFSIIDFI